MSQAGMCAAWASHVGGRTEQQDHAACLASRDGRHHLLVVADGMGGSLGGGLAARVVIETAERLWSGAEQPPADPSAFLENLCQQAHLAIRRDGERCGEAAGSTVVALVVTPARAWWVHVGDSRLYAFRDGRPVFRTEDHTLVQHLVRSGQVAEADAGAHPEQHKLLRGLGGEDAPDTTHGQMQVGAETGFVLCTDGFWATVEAGEMAALLRAAAPWAACARSAEVAVARSGAAADNATVAVLQPAGGARRLALRQLWPLYAAAAATLAMALLYVLR